MHITLTSLALDCGKASEATEGGGGGGGAGGSLTGGASACEEPFAGTEVAPGTGGNAANASALVCARVVDFGVD